MPPSAQRVENISEPALGNINEPKMIWVGNKRDPRQYPMEVICAGPQY